MRMLEKLKSLTQITLLRVMMFVSSTYCVRAIIIGWPLGQLLRFRR